MCEGPSSISGPIPPDPSLFPQYYKRPASARGRLEGNQNGTLALLSGPLAPDPELHPGFYSARTPAHPPRISPNATHILERGQRGVVGELLKLDGVAITPVPKQKQRVQDFSKENVRRLREIQRRCKEQEAKRAQTRPAPVKALWTSSKYHNVPSRVVAQLQVSSPTAKPQCQNFLRAHSKGGSLPRPQSTTSVVALKRPASCNSIEDKSIQAHTAYLPCQFSPYRGRAGLSVFDSSDEALNLSTSKSNLQVQGQSIDFIKHNALAAKKTVLRRSQSLTDLKNKTIPTAVKGQVPQYLEERKEQWQREEEERKRNAPDPSAPAGHTLMPENERQETLKSLRNTHASLVTELLSLPLKADSLSVRSRRAQLDCRLSEIEEAIKIFSRDKVYVKIDS